MKYKKFYRKDVKDAMLAAVCGLAGVFAGLALVGLLEKLPQENEQPTAATKKELLNAINLSREALEQELQKRLLQ